MKAILCVLDLILVCFCAYYWWHADGPQWQLLWLAAGNSFWATFKLTADS